ncbi:MAG: BON domain-containing protein [Gaiellaceae bacterium]
MTTTEIPLAFLDRLLDGTMQRSGGGVLNRFGQRSAPASALIERIASQAMRGQLSATVDRVVDQAMDRLDRATGRERKRSHSVLLFGAGFATGIAAVTVVAWRSRLRRRFSAQLREDVAIHEERVAGLDDTELAHKVQSIVFRDPSLPKGKVSINAEKGKVFLRGQVDAPDTIVRIERSVRDVEGVEAVENLLHVPGTPAPHPQGGALIETEGR